jgi:hypothetical protein
MLVASGLIHQAAAKPKGYDYVDLFDDGSKSLFGTASNKAHASHQGVKDDKYSLSRVYHVPYETEDEKTHILDELRHTLCSDCSQAKWVDNALLRDLKRIRVLQVKLLQEDDARIRQLQEAGNARQEVFTRRSLAKKGKKSDEAHQTYLEQVQ